MPSLVLDTCYLFNPHQLLARTAAHPASPLMIEVVQWEGCWRASVERGGEPAPEPHHVSCIVPGTFIYVTTFHSHNYHVKYVFLPLVFPNEETEGQRC